MDPNFDTLNSIKDVYNFSTNPIFVQQYGQYAHAAVLDIKKPYEDDTSGEHMDDMDRPLSEALYKIGLKKADSNMFAPEIDPQLFDCDGVINSISGEEYVEKHSVSGKEIGIPRQKIVAIFDVSQIHILGSKQDIENFKSFVTE